MSDVIVKKKPGKRGIIRNPWGASKKGDPAVVKKLWVDGYRGYEIAERIKLSASTVSRYMRDLEFNYQERAAHYENRAKLLREGSVKL